ncbi:MAG TPA: hypothetical protein VNX88_09175 [Terriglobales bacterium]|jgi:hypothetical protein|nr:hypothetical protein [Terriglobales bacterium]
MKLKQQFRFCAPAIHVKEATLSKSGEHVLHGTCHHLIDEYLEPDREALESVANCPADPLAVRRFVLRFGPLRHSDVEGSKLKLAITGFLKSQQVLRHIWQDAIGTCVPRRMTTERRSLMLPRVTEVTGSFDFSGGELTFVAHDLFEASILKLFTFAQRGILKRCARVDCNVLPYFISDHPRARYCSEQCAQKAQAIWKKQWWHEKGQSWRKEQKSKQQKQKGKS